MMPLQNTATKVVIAGVSVSAAATVTGVVDTLGFDECAIDVELDSQAATSNNPTTMKLSESDDLTTYADIAAFTGDATDGFAISAISSTAVNVTRMNVDLRARKRYLKVTVAPLGTTGVISVRATLGKAGDSTIARAAMQQVVDG